MKETKYNYLSHYSFDKDTDIQKAIEYTILNYMHFQLGWSIDECKIV